MKRIRKTLYALACLAASALVFAAGAEAAIKDADVHEAWSEVCRIADMEKLPLTIEEKDTPNAWVTSGKSVTVTRGLMKILRNKEEMFGVLAHEAGHAKLGHHGETVNKHAGINIAAILLGKALGSSAIGNTAVNVGANLASAGFSREMEVEADDFAVDIALKGGHDPTGIYYALKRLSDAAGKTEPSGFNSHPPDERRLKHVKDRILSKAPDTVFPE